MVDFFDIFDSSLRSALTFDIHTRRVPLGLRADAPVMLVCLRLAAGKAAARVRRLGVPESPKSEICMRALHGINRRSGHSDDSLRPGYRCENVAISST